MKKFGIFLGLAWRGVRRQSRRSLLTATAMVLGLALLIFTRALADGGHEDWIDAGVRMGSGHVVVQAPGFRTSRDIGDRIPGTLLPQISDALGTAGVSEYILARSDRVEVQGLANSASGAVPVMIVGVDPTQEIEYGTVHDGPVEGRYLEPGDRLQAYVGAALAERLGLHVGSRLVLSAQDATGEIAGQFVRVVGIFETGLPALDQGLVHIPLPTAQSWLAMGPDLTSVALVLHSSFVVEDVTAILTAALERGELDVLGWRESMPELDSAVRIDDYGDYVFHTILFVIIALAIVNTILMSVFYRTREFGVLRAMGLTKGQTASIVFLEGVILTCISGIVGIVLGYSFTWIFFRNGLDFSAFWSEDFEIAGTVIDPIIVPVFRLAQLKQSIVLIFTVGILASLYPSYRATQIDVAEAMKFEE